MHIQDARRPDRLEVRVSKLQMHTAADVARFQHGSAPSGAVNRNRNRFRTEYRVSRNQRLVPTLIEDRILMILRVDPKDSPGKQAAEMHAALDLGLYNIPIYPVGQIRVWPEHLRKVPLRHHFPERGLRL